jgi:pentapeptide repeat protein
MDIKTPNGRTKLRVEGELRGANLSRKNLSGVTLENTDLRGTNFSSADLTGSNFSNADLRGADLRNAHLQGANLLRRGFTHNFQNPREFPDRDPTNRARHPVGAEAKHPRW